MGFSRYSISQSPRLRTFACAAMVTLGPAALTAPPAVAQVSVSPPIELPGITVTAPRRTASPPVAPSTAARSGPSVVVSPTSVPTPSENVASSVTVITAQDLEAEQRRTAPDALSTVPGINVVQTGGAGGLTSIFMRGTNSNHVKVLIDGMEVSDPSSQNRSFDLGHLLTGDIAQI